MRARAIVVVALAAVAAFSGGAVLAENQEVSSSAMPAGAAAIDQQAATTEADPPPAETAPIVPPAMVQEPPEGAPPVGGEQPKKIDWRRSKAKGEPWDGKLARGVLLPREGAGWFSWDPIKERSPNRQWRRWGTNTLIRTTLRVLRRWRAAHPPAPRLPIGDLSRTRGGDFGPQFGALGHASHQNGLDIDIYYPRKDGKPKPPVKPSQVRVGVSQDLVDRFVDAGAEKVFVGPNLPLDGPKDVVVPLVHHDNHIHVRIPNPRR